MMFQNLERHVLKTADTDVTYHQGLLPIDEADDTLQHLISDINWRRESMLVYGQPKLFPRLTAWYGDANKSYTFSGITLQPDAWTPLVSKIKAAVESKCGQTFNSVLLNYYRDGSDSIGWHTDDEKELGDNPTVASVSFGGARRFMIRERKSKKLVQDVLLEHNSLLIMRGAMMKLYHHQIPKTSASVPARINLTFRTIVPKP